MKALRTAFVRLTNTDTWEAAQELYPHFATDDQLLKYIHVDLKKSIPQSFNDFCHRAKSSSSADKADGPMEVQFGAVTGTIIESNNVTEISGHRIQASCSNFCGANLTLASLEEVSSIE